MSIEYEKEKDTFISDHIGALRGYRVHIERIYQSDPRIQAKVFGTRGLWIRIPDHITDIGEAIVHFVKQNAHIYGHDSIVDNPKKG